MSINDRCYMFNLLQISMSVQILVLVMYMRHAATFQGLTSVCANLDISGMVPRAMVSKL
jgi:hypothetical protein